MGKKLAVGLLIALIVVVVGARVYRIYEAHHPPASPAFVPHPSASFPPASGRNGGVPAADSTAENKNIAAEPMAFQPRPGETLTFAANVTKLNSTVANLEVKVVDRRSVSGKNAWHLQAFAHTENPYRMVFELDDQFDSYSDLANFVGLQYEMHLSERGQKADVVQRLTSSGKEPAPADAAAARVLAGTRDPIGMLMYLRSVDWNKTNEVRSPVFDGHKLYDVRAALVGKGQHVSVAAGKFTTTKIEIHVLDNGKEMKDAHFLLYLADDAQRLPVLMEAVLPIATARVELTKVQ